MLITCDIYHLYVDKYVLINIELLFIICKWIDNQYYETLMNIKKE